VRLKSGALAGFKAGFEWGSSGGGRFGVGLAGLHMDVNLNNVTFFAFEFI
jgi:hypothetical protein